MQAALEQGAGGKRESEYTQKAKPQHKKPGMGGAEHMTTGLVRKAAEADRKHRQKLDEGY